MKKMLALAIIGAFAAAGAVAAGAAVAGAFVAGAVAAGASAANAGLPATTNAPRIAKASSFFMRISWKMAGSIECFGSLATAG